MLDSGDAELKIYDKYLNFFYLLGNCLNIQIYSNIL